MASLLPNTLPLAMLMELTHRCPLRCAYCSNPLALSPASATTCACCGERSHTGSV